MAFQNDIDLLNPPAELEKKKHKLKYLVQTPNSFFMVIFKKKNPFLYTYLDICIHSQIVVVCGNCQTILCQPIGSKARLTVMTR
ncbi:hypothetical protein ES332_D10G110600v1 [Gossypium tomentosum]|uniref:40S ribosomal protein S27 n=1 Tax=Gossypium tomentosum TaxID=34277 RepID=A0A5D2J3P3_GOSTO|nr:hypothetical protein ES332_D10G110600v1 [Gossypium tomentosum]